LSAREKAAIESRPTADVQAYDLYLHARELFVEYKYPEAVDLLEQAVARDPKFALAYCLLANVNLYIYRYGEDMSPARLERARVAAETALRLAPDLPESHLAQAQYYYNGLRDYEKAQAELASAPASPAGRAKFFDLTALTERRLGHWKEALRSGEKAWEIDPHDPFVATELIQTYQFLRRNTEAEKKADQAIRNIPNRAGPFRAVKADCIISQGDLARAQVFLETIPDEAEQKHVTLARTAFYQRDFAKALLDIEAARKAEMRPPYSFLDLMDGSIARAQGDTEKSKQMFEKARETLEASLEKRPNDAPAIVNLAWAYAGLGQKEEALRASQQAVQLVPSWRDAVEGPGYAAMQAMVQAWVGNKEAAIEQLTALMKQAGSPSYGELKFDPDWDDLRQDPRFAELIAEAAKPIKIE
jgi:tetratricopeptide (TPR) repeat protein